MSYYLISVRKLYGFHLERLFKLHKIEDTAFLVYTPDDVCLITHLHVNIFYVDNGVKQGGLIYPILYYIYMDDLSMPLNKSIKKCWCNN